jgi:hypothetical protein
MVLKALWHWAVMAALRSELVILPTDGPFLPPNGAVLPENEKNGIKSGNLPIEDLTCLSVNKV